MRGSDAVAGSLFSYVDLDKRVRVDHPLRVIRSIVNATLMDLSGAFDALYSPFGRESIPPERLLRALLLQAFYSIRSHGASLWQGSIISSSGDLRLQCPNGVQA
jgi:transposase